MTDAGPTAEERRLLDDLGRAVRSAPRHVREIEIGIPLSIALGKLRPAVACGGCSTPLEFEGIPARTTVGMSSPFRLLLDPTAAAT